MSPSAIDPFLRYKMWVLVPHLETDDPNLQYYYDFSQSLKEYTRVFDELKAEWQWQPVTMQSIPQTISDIKRQSNGHLPLVINLCDGDEINGTPGISVIHELEKQQLPYTGSDAFFYNITTSKFPMKEAFDKAGVPTPKWAIIDGDEEHIRQICQRIGTPLIIKPAISGGSMGVSVKNVVQSEQELLHRVHELNNGYRGWQLTTGGLLAEEFIKGPEFTSLIVGSSDDPANCQVYEPVERVFHKSLPETEKFLSFDRLWEIYEHESPMPNNENFYDYIPVPEPLSTAIKEISLKAYCAVGGQGYGRLDIRMDSATGNLYVLEVNAQCGLSEDEDYTSIGAILRVSGKSFTQLVTEIIKEGLNKRIV
jgi:D-alanine-D-alanine ligase